MKIPIVLCYFKRDLRTQDHAPLDEATRHARAIGARVVGVYIFEPEIVTAPDYSSFHRDFITQSLRDLLTSLGSYGIPLSIGYDHADIFFARLIDRYDIHAVYSHEETGNLLTYARDRRLREFFAGHGVVWREHPTNGVVRRLKSRDKWSGVFDERMSAPLIRLDYTQPLSGLESLITLAYSPVLTARGVQIGGEKTAHQVLTSFLSERVTRYRGGMTRPIAGMSASSRLSPYIAYGCLSLRQVYQATLEEIARRSSLVGEGSSSRTLHGLRAFLSRLHWQSHFVQKLEDAPDMETSSLFSDFDIVRAQHASDEIMSAIETAQTGVPYIDAIIRQLTHTGWTNFRSRAALVSFVCNTALQPWQGRFAHFLARLFVDYEPGIHYPQIQMQAGVTGINTLRIYNPIKQAQDKDEDGELLRRYVPELAKLPRELQIAPWNISKLDEMTYGVILGRDYPHPVVDVLGANRHAREIFYAIKKGRSPEQKQKIYQKHGSRKYRRSETHPSSEIVNPDSDQMNLFSL